MERMVKTYLYFKPITRILVKLWFVKSAGRNSILKIAWYAALLAQVAHAQAADRKHVKRTITPPLISPFLLN